MKEPFDRDQSLDQSIAAALRDRPERATIPGLAERAIALAQASKPSAASSESQLRLWAIQRQRDLLINAVAACVLIGLIFVCWNAIGGSISVTDASSNVTVSNVDPSSDLIYGLSADQWLLASAAMVVGIITLFCLEKAFAQERSKWRVSAAMLATIQR